MQDVIQVWRGGITSGTIKKEKSFVKIVPGLNFEYGEKIGIRIKFDIPSKGGGVTKIILWIPPDKFSEIIEYMAIANRDETKLSLQKLEPIFEMSAEELDGLQWIYLYE